MSDTPAKPDPYAPWRNRDYRRYAISWFAMTFSKRVETLAAQVYFVKLFDTSDAFLALAGMALAQALPVMLLAIAGGQLADRFDRRRVMIITHCLSLIAAAGLLGVALLDGPVAWIFAFLALDAVGQALNGPSRSAMLPHLVSSANFPTAVAWNSSVFYIGSVTGPMVAGAILALSATSAPAFAVVMACRFISVVGIAMVRYQHPHRPDASISWESVVAGIRFVRGTKLILATITLDLFAVLFGGAVYLLPIFAEDILHVGPIGLGFLQAADCIGAVCMAMLLAHMPPMRRAGVMLLWAVAGFGVATIVFGFSQWFWLSLLAMFLVARWTTSALWCATRWCKCSRPIICEVASRQSTTSSLWLPTTLAD